MMPQTDRALLERIARDVQGIRERLPVAEHRIGEHKGRLDGLEVRVRALEERVTRLTVIAGAAGGVVGALLGAGLRALLG